MTTVDLNKEIAYGKAALAHIIKHQRGGWMQQQCPALHRRTPQFEAWHKYFRDHLGFEPYAMRRVRIGIGQAFTVPADWPWQFDASYPQP